MDPFWQGVLYGLVNGAVVSGLVFYKAYLQFRVGVEQAVTDAMKKLNEDFSEFMTWRNDHGSK